MTSTSARVRRSSCPSQFGTPAVPHLVVQTGKEGYVYLLNAQDLGGVSAGNAGALAVHGPVGGAWATPGVWPGNGGYIYIPTAGGGSKSLGNASQGDFNVFNVRRPSGASGQFQLVLAAKGPQAVGYGTTSPIVTSNGLTPGSAVVWIVQLPGSAGGDADLQAYDAVPSAGGSTGPGTLALIGEWPVANATKFVSPGVGDNRLFVPTTNGRVSVFGLHASAIVSGRGTAFSPTTVGHSATTTLHFTLHRSVSITRTAGVCGVCTRTSQFAVTATSPAFVNGRVSLRAGQVLSVTARFRPTGGAGDRSDVLRLVTSAGESDFSLFGTARASTPWVTSSTRGLTLPAYIVGGDQPARSSFTFTNFGAAPATILGYGAAIAPFVLSGAPKVGARLAPGASVTIHVTLSTSTPGSYHRTLLMRTDSPSSDQSTLVNLSGAASVAPILAAAPTSLSFGTSAAPVAAGTTGVKSVTVSNTGGSTLRLTSVTATGPFALATPVAPDLLIPSGESITLDVIYLPSASGHQTGSLVLAATGLAPLSVPLTGTSTGTSSIIADPAAGGWLLGGDASLSGSTLSLTADSFDRSGSAFWPVPITSGTFSANFSVTAADGSGGDGSALVLADATTSTTPPTAPLGGAGSLVGFGGIAGLAVVIGDYQDPGTPTSEWVNIATGVNTATGGLAFVGAPVPIDVSNQDAPVDVTVTLAGSVLSVWVDGSPVLSQPVDAPSSFLLGFTAATGHYTNLHLIDGASFAVATTAAS